MSALAGGDGPRYACEIAELRRVLDETTIVGHPRRDEELAELVRLITRCPDEAQRMARGSA